MPDAQAGQRDVDHLRIRHAVALERLFELAGIFHAGTLVEAEGFRRAEGEHAHLARLRLRAAKAQRVHLPLAEVSPGPPLAAELAMLEHGLDGKRLPERRALAGQILAAGTQLQRQQGQQAVADPADPAGLAPDPDRVQGGQHRHGSPRAQNWK